MKKYLAILSILICFSSVVYSKKLCDLPEIFRSPSILVIEDIFVVTDMSSSSVHIYDRDTLQHLKVFGKKGEGPGEFKYSPSVFYDGTQLVVMSMGKISLYTREGNLKREIKIPMGIVPRRYTNKRIVATKMIQPDKVTGYTVTKSKVLILDEQLNELADVYTLPRGGLVLTTANAPKRKLEFLSHREYCLVSRDRIFISKTEKGFYFDVYDLEGGKVFAIDFPYKKIRVDGAEKKKLIEERKKQLEQGRSKTTWDDYMKRFRGVSFPDYYPAYRSFSIQNEVLIVHTHHKMDNKRECFLFNMDGEFIKKVFLPSGYRSFLFENVFYYLYENEETEMWELHVEEIE